MLQREMVEKLEETASAAAAALAEEACFADDLLLFDFTNDTSSAASGELQHQAFLFQNWFDDDLPGLPEESGGGENEEEELEWLSNKDAFPALETSFEISSHSHSSSSGGGGGGGGGGGWSGSKGGGAAATDVVGEGQNPFWVTAAATSFCVPARPRSKGRTPRRRVPAVVSSPPAATATATEAEWRRCRHCLAEETPQWRAGPEGPKTLCNACGVRYKSGRLVPEYRPASSPTFSAAIHSNSHRRVLEMRRQKVSRDREVPRRRRQRRSQFL